MSLDLNKEEIRLLLESLKLNVNKIPVNTAREADELYLALQVKEKLISRLEELYEN